MAHGVARVTPELKIVKKHSGLTGDALLNDITSHTDLPSMILARYDLLVLWDLSSRFQEPSWRVNVDVISVDAGLSSVWNNA